MIAATGHRPDKLGGYSDRVHEDLTRLAVAALAEAAMWPVISGMALGWDMAVAEAAARIGLPFTAAVPFLGQESRWPAESRARYRRLLKKAETVTIVCEGGYAGWKMQRRNEWMVDNAQTILALWNGSSGGTANCVAYAKSKGKDVRNIWDRWALS